MQNVVKANFRKVEELEHLEYSDSLSLQDLAQFNESIDLTTIHLMVLRYQGVGKDLDPKGQKLRASADLYRLLVLSGREKIGVSRPFAQELLDDINFLKKMEENETNEGEVL